MYTASVEKSSSDISSETFVGKVFPQVSAPLGDDGFIISFSIDETDKYLQFYHQYGFVVLRDLYSKDSINNAINDIWNLIEQLRRDIKRDDPRTWEYWPGLASLGLLSQALSPSSWTNRVNPKLYQVFRSIMGRDDLWVSVDNWGVMRPTRSIPKKPLSPNRIRTTVDLGDNVTSNEVEDKSDWKTQSKWLHWDLNPFMWVSQSEGLDYEFEEFISENNGSKNDGYPKLQGLLNLIDARPCDGGFLVVPSFHHHIKEWASQSHLSTYKNSQLDSPDFVYVPNNDPLQKQVQKIPLKAGDFLIWSSEMPHQNFENDSNRFRMVQYIKMFGVPPKNSTGVDLRRKLMERYSPKDLQEVTLARKLFGLDPY